MGKNTGLMVIFFVAVGLSLNAAGPGWGDRTGRFGADQTWALQSNFDNLNPANLDDDEIAGLLLMREEEKLARDVYDYFANLWNFPIFSNISNSEQQHMNAIGWLLEAYGIDDPVDDDRDRGSFSNTAIAKLYGELTARGEASLKEALAVGRDIEKLDIADLERLMPQSDEDAIQAVYSNLLRGSYNHLAAFERQLSSQGRGWGFRRSQRGRGY